MYATAFTIEPVEDGYYARKLRVVIQRKRLSQEELLRVLQEVYVKEDDGSKTLLVPYNEEVSRVSLSSQRQANASVKVRFRRTLLSSSTRSSTKPNIDLTFFRQLRAILFRIAIPSRSGPRRLSSSPCIRSSWCRETILSIAVARLDGIIVRDLVRADARGFLRGLVLWFLLAIPSTYTNSMGVDQYITADVESWAESLSVLYGNVLKPSLDLVLFTMLLFCNYYATVAILRAVTPAFGKLAAVEARLEGEYRAGMGRVGRGERRSRVSLSVGFYDGGARERSILTAAYMRLIKHVNSIYKIRIAYEWTEDFVIKYLWSAAGYVLIAVPLLYTRRRRRAQHEKPDSVEEGNAVANRTESYISNRRLLVSLADAGGRLMYAYKDLLELAGLTTRLYTLFSTLHNLPPLPCATSELDDTIELAHVDVRIPSANKMVESSEAEKEIAPLVKDLSLILKEGEHLMITGSNGVGKTAVARVLAGLWAPQGPNSRVKRPKNCGNHPGVFVVPQRAYMVTGSLLEQMIYPHSYAEFLESGKTEKDLRNILEMVYLAYLPEREGGWTTRKEWRDVLSGGEKQRMSLARVFYHKPEFAILDECTSAVSSDVEGRMYEHLKAQGINLITISLRPSLSKYHTRLLTLNGDGTGSWTLTRVGTAEERVGIDREIITLENKLKEVDVWRNV
ncbi:hypothetical protein EDD18DRAFT_1312780 [Armillaria luteobubalina]|uniref:ABC transporter domain-containing protein n=1 Tax=Armillaria luteobubalina TaxID=153913 RepID=A0AA39P4B7_9AGAR|nr:hypothetical protein EDD18DRAFT_1312780 [Armillaria luteobubalina]